MEENYEQAQDISEIETIFKKSIPGESIVWQNKEKGRVVYDITDIGFNAEEHKCKVSLRPSSNAISSSQTIFIKLSHRQSIFRITDYKLDGQIVRFTVPGVVKALNTQKYKRMDFDITKVDKKINLYCENIAWDTKEIVSAKVMNISQKGLCVVVPDVHRNLIESAQIVYLKSFFEHEFDTKIFIQPTYMLKMRYRAQGILNIVNRIGFEIDAVVDEKFFR
jgi:hypothetical protein